MSYYNITSSKVSYSGEYAREGLFGVNVEAIKDSFDSLFGDKYESVSGTNVRYPGGTWGELYWDMTDPDSESTVANRGNIPISEYFAFCQEQGQKPIVTLPTKRYVGDPEAAVSELTAFLDALVAGEYGEVEDIHFEIGNEFYVDGGEVEGAFYARPISGEEYASVAIPMIEVIESYSELNSEISVQAGFTNQQNSGVLDGFEESGAFDSIDYIVIHPYFDRLEVIDNHFGQWMTRVEQWETAAGREYDVYMSEWNVKNWPDAKYEDRFGRPIDPLEFDWGLAQVPALVEAVAYSVAAGIEFASIWAVQQRTNTALAGPKEETEPRASGEAFRMMSESISDHELVYYFDNNSMPEEVMIHSFESQSELVSYASVLEFGEDPTASVSLDFGLSEDAVQNVWVERLYVSGDPTEPDAETVIERYAVADWTGAMYHEFGMENELVQITFVFSGHLNESVTILGTADDDDYWASIVDDMIEGNEGDDEIWARNGADSVDSGIGADLVLLGGGDDNANAKQGDDEVRGGAGDDLIFGELGDDLLKGGIGADKIFGGGGDDEVYGSDGDDYLSGGAGSDILKGGAGQDTFYFNNGGDDIIRDFNLEMDNIKIRGYEADDFEQQELETGTLLSFDEGSILLRGVFGGVDYESFSFV